MWGVWGLECVCEELFLKMSGRIEGYSGHQLLLLVGEAKGTTQTMGCVKQFRFIFHVNFGLIECSHAVKFQLC